MSHTLEWDMTVGAPLDFVRDYLLDVNNWPQMQLLAVDTAGPTHQELRWEGPEWQAGSGLVNEMHIKSGFVKSKSVFRYEVQVPNSGELYRICGKKLGIKATISCQIQEVSPEETRISYRSDLEGWAAAAAKLLPADKMADQMREAARPVIELAWLRSLDDLSPATPTGNEETR